MGHITFALYIGPEEATQLMTEDHSNDPSACFMFI